MSGLLVALARRHKCLPPHSRAGNNRYDIKLEESLAKDTTVLRSKYTVCGRAC